jgi:hypothetical protein
MYEVLLRFISISAPILGTLLLWAVHWGPEDAVSYPAKWAKLSGIDSPPPWLVSSSSDDWATIGIAGIVVGIVAVALRLRQRRRAAE